MWVLPEGHSSGSVPASSKKTKTLDENDLKCLCLETDSFVKVSFSVQTGAAVGREADSSAVCAFNSQKSH